MRRKKKNNFIKILVFLLLCIGIGYAALMTDLSINGVANVTQSSWDIHFDNLVVNQESSATVDQAANINTPTSISYEITLTKPGDYYEFNVDAVNEGTIDAMIESISSKLNNVEITTLPNYIEYSITHEDDIAIGPNQLLEAGSSETYKVRIGYKKDINPEDLPSTDQTLNFLFTVTYIQADENARPRPKKPVIMTTNMNDYSAFRGSTYKQKIKTITLDDEINPPANVIASWDIGVAQNGNVMAYITQNSNDNTMYDLYIQGDGHLYANPDSSYLFFDFEQVETLNNMDVLDVSEVTNMKSMFSDLGLYSTSFTLDLGNNFDTSKVTNMSGMFSETGAYNTVFTLDLGDKFDTSNVTDMSYMFFWTGHNSTIFTLDLGDKFDTSKVTNMGNMFCATGIDSTVMTLNLGNKFDTRNVTNMEHMFTGVGSENSNFVLNLGSKFKTSKVTNMDYMFSNTGTANSYFELDLSTFDFSNVTSCQEIFYNIKATEKIYVKDAAAQSWVISRHVNLTTANVLIKTS